MKSKILIYVEKQEYIDDYRKAGVAAFLFALEDFCVGYNTFKLEDIKRIEVSNKYLLINRILDCRDIDKLKELLNNIDYVDGIVFEDIGVYQIFSKMQLNVELIYFQNHFGTNVSSINYWLKKVDSCFVCNELTYDEVSYITKNSIKSVCLHLFGYNQVMYSRRLLVTNWCNEFNVVYKNNMIIEDIATKTKFRAFENKYGTIMYSQNIFNGKRLLNLDNVKFYYINTMMIEHDIIMDFLKDMDKHNNENEDEGFLDKETIFKLKERSK